MRFGVLLVAALSLLTAVPVSSQTAAPNDMSFFAVEGELERRVHITCEGTVVRSSHSEKVCWVHQMTYQVNAGTGECILSRVSAWEDVRVVETRGRWRTSALHDVGVTSSFAFSVRRSQLRSLVETRGSVGTPHNMTTLQYRPAAQSQLDIGRCLAL